MAVNSDAHLWTPFKQLYETLQSAIFKKQPDSVHDLEEALRKHKPNFISLLRNPPQNASDREAVKLASSEGLLVRGEPRRQTFSSQFIAEALIISDLFSLNEFAAVEFLMAGELNQPNYPGLTRGLVAVLLYYDGRRSLVNSLRTLVQALPGRTWTLGLGKDIINIITRFTDQLVQEGLISKILDLVSVMDVTKEMERLQRDRALGTAKHKKQVVDLFCEIKLSLAECTYCLACQQPLNKTDTLRLIQHLKGDNSLEADGTLQPVSLCLLMTLLYSFDLSVLEREDAEEVIERLPILCDDSYVADIHREMKFDHVWAVPGLKAVAQLAWAVALRQLSTYPAVTGVNEYCEDDEMLFDLACQGRVFSFLSNAVVVGRDFHHEEFYLRRIHGLLTDFIQHMPLKVKELRNRGDETARILMAHTQEGLDPPQMLRRDFEQMLKLIEVVYEKDPLHLELSVDYWCPSELSSVQESFYHYRPPQKQVALYKFVRLAGDLLPPLLYVPYIGMLTSLANNERSAPHCFNLLKMNGMTAGGAASMVSWDHIFSSLNQYFTSLRQEMPNSSDVSQVYRARQIRGITAQEVEGLKAVLHLTRCVIEQNENCRIAIHENQQWAVVNLLFGLVTCSVPSVMKAELLLLMSALSKTSEIGAAMWQTLELSQLLPTVQSTSKKPGGIQVELEEVEARNEEYPVTRAFLNLMNTLTDIPVPAALGAGIRSPGFGPYLDFIQNVVLLKFSSRAYKNPGEKWELATNALEILRKLLVEHTIRADDFVEQIVEIPGVGTVAADKPPGHTLMIHMLNDSGLHRMVLKILDEAIKQFEQYAPIPGKEWFEKASLLALQMVEITLEKETAFVDMVRESGTSVMLSAMDKLLLGINPRSGRADHLVNVAKFLTYNNLPDHSLSAMKILFLVCRSSPIQRQLVNLFTVDKATAEDLLHGFVECLDVDEVEQKPAEWSEMLEDRDEMASGYAKNATRQYLLQLLQHSLEQPAPNLAHFLLGFELRKPASKTNLQDPGILGSPRTCLHSILAILDSGVGTQRGPTCLYDTPRLAELAYNLIYMLCANNETCAPTLRYLRTTHDFLFRQLQHLPFQIEDYGHQVISHQSWLLKTIAIELRMTALNRQRSHTHRLMRVLLSDADEDQTAVLQPVGDEPELGGFERFGDQSVFQSTMLGQSRPVQIQQQRRKLLNILDSVEFNQPYPRQLELEFFDPRLIEKIISTTESKTEQGVMYSNLQLLHRILMNEVNNLQGSTLAGQRPQILGEVSMVLKTVVTRNQVRESLHCKRQAFEAWRQVTEVLLTACPEDLLSQEMRQSILFELLQDLLVKVADEEALIELTAPVAGVVLTLMANLQHCFILSKKTHSDNYQRSAQYVTLLDKTGSGNLSMTWGQSSGSRTLFATSLQLYSRVLLTICGSQQRVRAHLYGALLYYLQIAQNQLNPAHSLMVEPEDKGLQGKLLSETDTEYEQLTKENVETILSYGDNFMDMVCGDACDGHDVGRMLALSVLDAVLSLDKFQQWLNFLSGKGYLQHLVDSVVQDDRELQALLTPTAAPLRALYIYESKMSLLTRVAESALGAHALLRCGIMPRLAACTFFDMRPEVDRHSQSLQTTTESDGFIPTSLARYQHLLFASLKLCLAVLTSLGIENRDAGNQVMQFIVSHGDVFHTILRDRQPLLNLQSLQELALTTAVLSRANYQSQREVTGEVDSAAVEFCGHAARIERQVIALLSKYCLSEKLNKQLKNMESREMQEGRDIKAETKLAYLEVTAYVTAFCRALVSSPGVSSQYCRMLFSPSLEDANARDIRSSEDFSVVTLSPAHVPSLGIIVYQLKQCSNRFMSVYDSKQQHQRKLQGLTDLSSEDLKEFSGLGATEKISSQQRQQLARKRLVQIIGHKAQELRHYAYIIENCLFILWRHLEYYLIHCVPTDQQPSIYQSHIKRQQQMRRLQDMTGAVQLPPPDFESTILSDMDDLTGGVTRKDLDTLKQVAPSVISDSLLKKLQEINQCYCKNRTHYGFDEALIRRVKRLLRLHTAS
ncbi:hypothetical protein ScPMuIL_012976 [Solemya velum]